MNKEDLKKIAIDAAMERVVGSSSVPVKYLADLIKRFSTFVDEYKAERAEATAQYEQEKIFLREIQKNLNEYAVELSRIRQIKGEKGDRGADGKDGRDGRDGKDAREVDITSLKASILREIRTPKDGKDAVIDDKKVEKMLDKLIQKHKERLDNEVASYRSQLAGKIYGENTWARGAGDTVKAGTNVTITVDENGNKVISAQGGSGGAQIATETVTATDAGGNAVNIDLTQLSQPWTSIEMVIRNGVIQNQSKWSIVGDTLTLQGAVITNDFQLQYQYA